MSLHSILSFGLVLGALLYAAALLLYRRNRMSTKRWYATIGYAIAALLFFALLAFFGILDQGTVGFLAVYTGALSIVSAWRYRPQTRLRTRSTAVKTDGNRSSILEIIPEQDRHFLQRTHRSLSLGAIWAVLGIRTTCTIEQDFPYNYNDVVLSIYHALRSLDKPIVALQDTPEGAIIEAKQPMTLFNWIGSLSFEIDDKGQSEVRVTGTFEIKGQVIDWGMGTETLNQVFSQAEYLLVQGKRSNIANFLSLVQTSGVDCQV